MDKTFMRALEALSGLFFRKKVVERPRYCELFIEVVALFIYIRNQPFVSHEQKALLRTLIGAAQRILTHLEWVDVRIKASNMLKQHPRIVGHWLDARDALEVRLRDVD